MKITKSKLKQIIKEELERALSEDDVGAPIYPQDPLAMAQAAAADPNMTAPWLSVKGHPDWGADWLTIHEMLMELGPDGVADAFDYFAHESINLPADGLIKEDPVVLEAFSYFWAWTDKKKARLQRDIEAGGEELEEDKGSKWMQKAVNPEHEGYCTPMTKKTCTPPRKALAKRFKKAAKKKKKKGGTGWEGKV